jgi:hypothetical protein
VSRVWRHLDALTAANLWHRAEDKESRVRLLSTGGRGVGGIWYESPSNTLKMFPNAHFQLTSQTRLGIARAPENATCCLQAAKRDGTTGEMCGKSLQGRLLHPFSCGTGPANMRPHRALQYAVLGSLKAAGAEADTERLIPELTRTVAGVAEDAYLDVVAHFPGECTRMLIDVTVRDPHAVRYEKEAWRTCGYSAAMAAKDKLKRYGDTVLPLPFEPYGRLGASGHVTIQKLMLRATSFCGSRVSRKFGHAMQAACERGLHYAQADVALLALGAAASRTHALIQSRGNAAAAFSLSAMI